VTPRRTRLLGRLEAFLLCAFGVMAWLFARGPSYTALMNPSFRWVTLTGAVLLTSLGLVLFLKPRRAPGRSAFVSFAVLALLVVLGRPDQSIGASIVPPDVGPVLPREGYDELLLENLFRTLSEEVEDVPEGKVVAQGRVHTIARDDGSVQHILLCPKVACCLADALAYAVRLELPPGVAPLEGASWVYVYGDLAKPDAPVALPPFRVGAIAYTAVSRNYLLRPEEFVDYRTLLEDVTGKIPEVQCAAFRNALQATGLEKVLQGEGTFTVFAPVDSAFLRQLRTLAPAGSDTVEAPRLRRYLESFIVPTSLSRSDLLEHPTLETLSGRRLEVEVANGRPVVEGARILFADQLGRNGIVHIVHPAWPPAAD